MDETTKQILSDHGVDEHRWTNRIYEDMEIIEAKVKSTDTTLAWNLVRDFNKLGWSHARVMPIAADVILVSLVRSKRRDRKGGTPP